MAPFRTLAALLLVSSSLSCAQVECRLNSECGDHARCSENRCVRDCTEDRDCPQEAPFCSRNGECIAAPTDAATDVSAELATDTPTSVDVPVDAPDAGMIDAPPIDLASPDVPATDLAAPSDLQPPSDIPSAMDVPVAMDVSIDRAPTDLGADVARMDVATDLPAPSPGLYTWTGIRPGTLAAPVAVAWHPSGSYALILSATSTVFRYDPTAATVTLAATAGTDVGWRGVSFTPDGARAILLGNTGSGATRHGRIFQWTDATSALAERTTEGFAMGTYESLRWAPDGRRGALLASGANAVYVWFIAPDGTRAPAPLARGIVPSTGCSDVTFGADGFGDPMLTVVCGTNTALVLTATAIDSGPAVWSSPPSASAGLIGNVSRIATRPQGDVALSVGWSSNRLYRVRGSVWEAGFSSPMLRGIFSVAWSTDGRRALAFGGNGYVHEYRHDLYTAGELTDVSIGLAGAPWTQPSSATVNDLAWRPGCDEGVAVGGSSTLSGTTAFVAPFRVAGGRACGM